VVGCSAGCSGQQTEGGILDADLATLVAAWPHLPEHIRAAIRTLVGPVAGGIGTVAKVATSSHCRARRRPAGPVRADAKVVRSSTARA
jgi:hypothetical protein